MLDGHSLLDLGLPQSAAKRGRAPASRQTPIIDIALVNNMPDTAIAAAERQFAALLQAAAAGEFEVRLHRFMLPERCGQGASGAAGYASIERIADAPIDAAIVTGCEPSAPSLPQEPYWDSLAKLVHWSRANTISTLWSCLAAHAAVLCLDGVERRPVAEKRSGVFACEIVAEDALVRGASEPIFTPHSRLNELPRQDLVACGYEILTDSQEAGVDVFVKRDDSLFVFFQGHPEYEPCSLLLEYRRDLGRYVRGESDRPPPAPRHYFAGETQARLESLTARARTAGRPRLLEPALRETLILDMRPWSSWSALLFANWLRGVGREKARREKANELRWARRLARVQL